MVIVLVNRGLLPGEAVESRLGGLIPFLEVFYSLFLFPQYILQLLGIIEAGVDADVRVVIDVAASLVVCLRVGGRMFDEAVEGHILFQIDHIDDLDLIRGEIDALLQDLQLMDSALGRLRFWQLGGRLVVLSDGIAEAGGLCF